VGRLVRRAKVTRQNGLTVLSNAYPQSEFIRSRDINFRPLGAETAPDGSMFLIDMHRGIIQQGNWVRKGSYLREVVQKWEMEKNVGKGRIYRLVHKTFKPGPKPRMLDESTAELVKHLAHPNGWWRDNAQKLIILRDDGKSVVPALEKMATDSGSALGRVHALWTLEGLDAVSPALLAKALEDGDHRVRQAALRVSEPFLSKGDASVVGAVSKLKNDPDADVAIQAINSIAYSGSSSEALASLADALIANHSDKPVIQAIEGNRKRLAEEQARLAEQRRINARFAEQMEQGAVIYKQLCFACHGGDGKGTPMAGQPGVTLGSPLPRSPRVLGSGGSLVRTVLHGLTGPLDGKTYPGQMLPLAANDDEWIAAAATYVRNSFGNDGGIISKEFVAAIRKQTGERLEPWTEAELEQMEPPLLANFKSWKLTASHNPAKAGAAIDGNPKTRFDTGATQQPGMWFQMEFPVATTLNRIVLNSAGSREDYPRQYEVRVSDNGKKWSEPIAQGTGRSPETDIIFPTATAKFVRIIQQGSSPGKYWSIHEMQVFGKQVPREMPEVKF
jgi:mono/diheme cytochrome c family protein